MVAASSILRPRRPAAVGALLACGLIGLHSLSSLNFLAPGSGGIAKATLPIAGLEAPRGDAEPRTAMHARFPDRSRNHGGGRTVFTMNRKPVLGYSIADIRDGKIAESAISVLRRLRSMVDEDHVNMITMRQEFFKPDYRKKLWTADYNQRMGRRMKLRKLKAKFEAEWNQWMRTEGRSQGLLEPVRYDGPKLGSYMTKELDEASEPDAVLKVLPSKQDMKTNKRYAMKGWSKLFPADMMAGQWEDAEADDNIFKIWKRPLHKQPYDIGKRGSNHVVRGNVF
eukprot:gb/GFBE01058379.1/.p1 GENE.gb/GFBE01058379.1/~~gb/GFBE01058379.1/.p1  ORF type:complete len:282 (+),score=63.00 gb/GFBE01058379.1/:1-846(+)